VDKFYVHLKLFSARSAHTDLFLTLILKCC